MSYSPNTDRRRGPCARSDLLGHRLVYYYDIISLRGGRAACRAARGEIDFRDDGGGGGGIKRHYAGRFLESDPTTRALWPRRLFPPTRSADNERRPGKETDSGDRGTGWRRTRLIYKYNNNIIHSRTNAVKKTRSHCALLRRTCVFAR